MTTLATRKDLFWIQSANAGHYALEGELSFSSVDLAWKKTAPFFRTQTPLVFDLAGITKADSAGLALLLEWRRLAGDSGVELRYVNLPRQLQAMAEVAGVDGILTFD